MPRIFDNIEQRLLPALAKTMETSDHADFCVGYFNLRGWRAIDEHIEKWDGGEGHCCRLLIGMQRLPDEEFRIARRLAAKEERLDTQTASQWALDMAKAFREQLAVGVPTNEDEAGLRRLAKQIKAKKVVVKLFLRHPLHAKLYLLFRPDPTNPTTGYLGSSNLTQSGLSEQGELNIDVLDQDACQKLSAWFENRWKDDWCIDISKELVEIIEESWAREEPIPPYHIYIKIAYHLSREALAGLTQYRIPKDFGNKLLDFQTAAVQIAAHHLNKRNGVMIGDVVGLGKTLMASALARIFEDDHGLETLIVCPKSLVPMWEDYRTRYRMCADVLSISRVINELPRMRRYRLMIIDESHNLRNREGRRYRALCEYIRANESKCILLSATPYNKTYMDLSSQLGLFVPADQDLGIRPERLLREIGEKEFRHRHQVPVRSLAAFEKSTHADDWRDLMRLYLVRRTRSFIQRNYAETDSDSGQKYLKFNDDRRSYFRTRIPQTIRFEVDTQYAQLLEDDVVNAINGLNLPRYGLGNYVVAARAESTEDESKILADLSRAGRGLMGFCRTGLLKRLESSGHAFLLSLERHVLRNFIFLHAIENELALPIGAIDVGPWDPYSSDQDADQSPRDDIDADDDEESEEPEGMLSPRTENDFRHQAAKFYELYAGLYKKRFRWLTSKYFGVKLRQHLIDDTRTLSDLLVRFGEWRPGQDAKLHALENMITRKHPDQKILVFTQFADTVYYLESQLRARGVSKMEAVTGSASDPTRLAQCFSPRSNEKNHFVSTEEELRVLIATDILSEGQNLQDCAIVVNYDLPWAIISLIQRAGRVDRIGQEHDILCYSFLPADGIERLIQLRKRVQTRLRENAEVMGTDESFFEDEDKTAVLDIYNEKAGILDDDGESEVDLSSYAYQIWKNATMDDPSLEKRIKDIPSVVHASKAHKPAPNRPDGALVYMRTAQEYDALMWTDRAGNSVTESQFEILQAAKCSPDTPALPRHDTHHNLVRKAAEHIAREEKHVGGQLGRPSSTRSRTYERLKNHAKNVKDTSPNAKLLHRAVGEIYQYPLHETAADTLKRQLRSGISDQDLAKLVIDFTEDGRLCVMHAEEKYQEPQIICSMGLINHSNANNP